MLENKLDKIKEEVYNALPRFGTHSFEHSERVYRLCMFLSKKIESDKSVLLPAALLHDICRDEDDHAIVSAEKARIILNRHGFSDEKIKLITHAISTHSFSRKRIANTIEAKILSDGDKLDALGAIGIYRAAAYINESPRGIEDFMKHFEEKLFQLDNQFYTYEAKKMAKKRIQFMKNYLKRLKKEVDLIE